MTDAVSKFIKAQEDAVALASDIKDEPSEYSIRVDAINAALSMNSSADGVMSVDDVLSASKKFEVYLKGAK